MPARQYASILVSISDVSVLLAMAALPFVLPFAIDMLAMWRSAGKLVHGPNAKGGTTNNEQLFAQVFMDDLGLYAGQMEPIWPPMPSMSA